MLANSLVFLTGYKVLRKGLTPAGVAHSWALGASVFSAFGPGGYLLVCLYFIFGTLVSMDVCAVVVGSFVKASCAGSSTPQPCTQSRCTRHANAPGGVLHARHAWPQATKLKMEQKQREGIAEARSGQRGPVSACRHECMQANLEGQSVMMAGHASAQACHHLSPPSSRKSIRARQLPHARRKRFTMQRVPCRARQCGRCVALKRVAAALRTAACRQAYGARASQVWRVQCWRC